MQRFYQAVELDEAEMARKRSASVEPSSKKKSRTVEEPRDRNDFVSGTAAKNPLVNENIKLIRIGIEKLHTCFLLNATVILF